MPFRPNITTNVYVSDTTEPGKLHPKMITERRITCKE
jgi:hypothetical protein